MEILNTLVLVLLALVPALIWFSIFNRENPEGILPDFYAVIAGGLSTIPVLFYQKLWGSEGNFVFFKVETVDFQQNISELFGFSSFSMAANIASNDGILTIAATAILFVFLGVGFLEEIFKHVVINPKFTPILGLVAIGAVIGLAITGGLSLLTLAGILLYLGFLFTLPKIIKFKSIDDVLSISILAAIGFSFVENVIYFYFKWGQLANQLGVDSIFEASFSDISGFLGFVLIRITVVTMIHVLCSGVFGYHFGLAHFAHPELQKEIREGRKHPIIDFIHKVFKTPEDKLFFYEQLVVGLLLSIALHGVYDVIAQLNILLPIGNGFPIIAIIMPVYFIGGFYYLFTILEEKKNRIKYGQLVEKTEYVN